MNYQAIAHITKPSNAALYHDIVLESEFEFEEGKKPWRIAGVLYPTPRTLETYDENLNISGSYSIYDYPIEVYMQTFPAYEVDLCV